MTSNTLEKGIKEAVPKLLDLARELTGNDISDNCKFILTEIKDSSENFHVQRLLRKKENDKKAPTTFSDLMPTLQNLYDNLYDINLHVYRAKKQLTIVDIRYYSKSSLDQEYRQKVLHVPPMLHCKVAQPPWLTDKKEKFDINWEHKQWLTNWKLFWARRKLKHQSG
ncbi:hypothetical protein A4D02_35760 [Niastella koreensis]|uniref:Uncharacterized protein n=2 Tax=Niastella koreensis TaxID=354356 RepID=G8THM4_NIAKG|nr:hypothetical protein [Niastella koreensis]AEV97452.1 hypothetical protein Niako_1076 [Niastella koreensis GR20-10]OQP44166.1 hypothetical protein A4D02_35760 [Niastella koreensis]